jgi:hypothetical protein
MCDPNDKSGGKDLHHAPVAVQRLEKHALPFKMEAVIVCDKYHDFLTHTLPTNKFLFDRTVVVTSPEDLKTQRVCEFNHVECILTDSLMSRWKGQFKKGAGINEGLGMLNRDGWVVHLDADIWLPPQTRLLIQGADLDTAMLYGIDRFLVKGYEAWNAFRALPDLQHEDDAYIHLGAFPIGTRVMSKEAGGYIPIGFFQMWHPWTSGIFDYPWEHTNAGRGDMVQAKRWPRSMRALIPEVICYHLESGDAVMSSNWNGRTTAQFGGNF